MQNRNKAERNFKISADVVWLIFSFLLAAFLAKRHAGMGAGFFSLETNEAFLLLFLCLAWQGFAKVVGLYDELRSRSFLLEWTAFGQNVLMQAVLAVSFLFAVKTSALSRFFTLLYVVLLLLLLGAWKSCLRMIMVWRQRRGRGLSFVLIVGAGETGRRFHDMITANAHLGYRMRGFVDDRPQPELGSLYLGRIDQLEPIIARDKVDDVVIALPDSAREQIGQVIALCESSPIRLTLIPDFFKFTSPRFRVSTLGDFPLISVRANRLEEANWRILKRSFDLLVTALLFAAVFSWLWPLLALLIKASSAGPVFFRQERWGEKNRRFVCYKFRSMVKESRDVDENGRYRQASRNDARVTRLGRFLRRSNLDELPQFFNVLKGEMSIVGPRPHPTPMNLEAKGAIRRYALRHLVRPGITGWAQVNGLRGETSEPEQLRRRVEADIWYIENWSFALDLKILWLSLLAMMKGDPNAY